MEFLLIMGIGTVLAVLVVIGSRPKRWCIREEQLRPHANSLPVQILCGKKTPPVRTRLENWNIWGIERHDNDPEHQPFPSPPPIIRSK
jgi:hypothetical protein